MFVKRFLIASAFVPFIISCSSETGENNEEILETEPSAQIEPASNTTVEAVEPIEQPAPVVEKDYSDVAIPYTEKGYPKLYATWGKKWVDDINTMLPLVVKKVAANPQCDAPSIADLSDNRSTVKQEAVFFVDCVNGERFYISQKELSENNDVQAESSILSGKPSQYIQPCREMIKAQLNYPDTFDEVFGSVNSFKGTSGNMVVEMDFIAKNAIGAEMPQSARCVFGTNGNNEAVISNR